MENYKDKILSISKKYSELNERLVDVQTTIDHLDKMRVEIKKELNANVLEEKSVINKIEESLGRSITQNDLIDIVKNHKDEN